ALGRGEQVPPVQTPLGHSVPSVQLAPSLVVATQVSLGALHAAPAAHFDSRHMPPAAGSSAQWPFWQAPPTHSHSAVHSPPSSTSGWTKLSQPGMPLKWLVVPSIWQVEERM